MADVLIESEVIRRSAPGLLNSAERVIDAAGYYAARRDRLPHHLDMPFGSTTSADDFGPARARPWRHHQHRHFAIRRGTKTRCPGYGGRRPRQGCIDYGLHMIVTDLAPEPEDMDDGGRRRGRLQAVQAYPTS